MATPPLPGASALQYCATHRSGQAVFTSLSPFGRGGAAALRVRAEDAERGVGEAEVRAERVEGGVGRRACDGSDRGSAPAEECRRRLVGRSSRSFLLDASIASLGSSAPARTGARSLEAPAPSRIVRFPRGARRASTAKSRDLGRRRRSRRVSPSKRSRLGRSRLGRGAFRGRAPPREAPRIQPSGLAESLARNTRVQGELSVPDVDPARDRMNWAHRFAPACARFFLFS